MAAKIAAANSGPMTDQVFITELPPYPDRDNAEVSANTMLDGGWTSGQAAEAMSNAKSKEYRALLEEAVEMFDETGCVCCLDGEEAPAESIVPDAKEYIAETIENPEATYDPKIWDAPGFALLVSWLAQKWRQRCQKLAPRGSKDPAQYLTKEQQKACLDSAAVELIREITQRRPLD